MHRGTTVVVSILLLVTATVVVAADPPRTIWNRTEAVGDLGGAAALGVAPDGATVFVASDRTAFGASLAVLAAHDARDGAPLWTRDDERDSRASALTMSPDGARVFVAGSTIGEDGFNTDYLTFACDAIDGSLAWRATYAGPVPFNPAFATGLATAPAGNRVFVTGWSLSRGFLGYDWATVSYGADDGTPYWAMRRNGSPSDGSADHANAVVVAPDGTGVVVTGRIQINGRGRFHTIAYDGGSGAMIWSGTEAGRGNGEAHAVAMSTSGDTVLAAGSVDDGRLAVVARRADDGTLDWIHSPDRPIGRFDIGRELAVSQVDGTVFVAVESGVPGDDADLWLVALDPSTGSPAWSNRSERSGDERVAAMKVHPDGDRVLVAVDVEDQGASRAAVLAFDAFDGNLLWEAWAAPADSTVADLAVDPDGGRMYTLAQSGTEVVIRAFGFDSGLDIDIAPGRSPNVLDLVDDEQVRVAILGRADLDVRSLDVTTARFGPNEAAPAAGPAPDDAPPEVVPGEFPDVNDDGYDDVIVPFVLPETGIACGDTSATLTVATFEGDTLSGSDEVVPVPCDQGTMDRCAKR